MKNIKKYENLLPINENNPNFSIKTFESFIDDGVSKIDWEEADRTIPRFSPFVVTDLETGKSWEMMRTSGKFHADVEPITKEDSKEMLSCFPKERSFESATYRPVIVSIGVERYKAALMGFPHAGSNSTPFGQKTKKLSGGFRNMPNWDYNRDNSIVGHFCLHFPGSVRHTDKKEDPNAQKAIMSF